MRERGLLHSIVILIFNEEMGLEFLFARRRQLVDPIGELREVILVSKGIKIPRQTLV